MNILWVRLKICLRRTRPKDANTFLRLILAVALSAPPVHADVSEAEPYVKPCEALLQAAAQRSLPAHFVASATTVEQRRQLLYDIGWIYNGPSFQAVLTTLAEDRGSLSVAKLDHVLSLDPVTFGAWAARVKTHLNLIHAAGPDAAAARVTEQVNIDFWAAARGADLVADYDSLFTEAVRHTLSALRELSLDRRAVKRTKLARSIVLRSLMGSLWISGLTMGLGLVNLGPNHREALPTTALIGFTGFILTTGLIYWLLLTRGSDGATHRIDQLLAQNHRDTTPHTFRGRVERDLVASAGRVSEFSAFAPASLEGALAAGLESLSPVDLAYLGHRELVELQRLASEAAGVDLSELRAALDATAKAARAVLKNPADLSSRFKISTALNHLAQLVGEVVDRPWDNFESALENMAIQLEAVARRAHDGSADTAEAQAMYQILFTRLDHDLKPIVARKFDVPDFRSASTTLKPLLDDLATSNPLGRDWRDFAEQTLLTLDRVGVMGPPPR